MLIFVLLGFEFLKQSAYYYILHYISGKKNYEEDVFFDQHIHIIAV